jgi:hypothetical protein
LMFKPHGGGRKERWPEDVRARALARAEVVGVKQAAGEVQVPEGTLRSWITRARQRAERDARDDDLLEEIRREGAAIIAAKEREARGGPVRPLARGEFLSPDPLADLRPPREGEVDKRNAVSDVPEPDEKSPRKRRRRRRKRADERAEVEAAESLPRASETGAVSAANRSLDPSDALPDYTLRRDDGSEYTVSRNDRDVGPNARR